MEDRMDESLEDEYAAQQDGRAVKQVLKELTAETEKEMAKEKREIEKSVSVLLVDISETLQLLSEQMGRLDEVTKTLPKTVAALTATTETVQCLANNLPTMIREQSLEEYKKVLDNAVKNYNQMRKSAAKWQKSIETERAGRFRMIMISAIVTPVFLLLNLIFK